MGYGIRDGIQKSIKTPNAILTKEEFMRSINCFAIFSIFALVVLFALPASVMAGDEAKTETATYLVTSPHTPEECLAALDEFAASGKNALDNWYWGCMDGDHTGYEFVQATSETEALKSVPENLREKADATMLSKFTAEQVASFHKMKQEKK
jgi:hypothetical protein